MDAEVAIGYKSVVLFRDGDRFGNPMDYAWFQDMSRQNMHQQTRAAASVSLAFEHILQI